MVFSSLIFLFLFLPVVLTTYFFLPRRFKNPFLMLGSLFFYAWGETFFVVAMVASIAFNYLSGLWVDRSRGTFSSKVGLAVAVTGNLSLLATYKYANFVTDNVNHLATWLDLPPVSLEPIHLPIGISFFTFQAISYVADVYRGEAPVQKNPFNLALYISLFPQLIAGPIVRYKDIIGQLTDRPQKAEEIAYGIRRFIVGLFKKVVIANTVAGPADRIFGLPGEDLTPGLAWLGAICYTLQIYFDFSAYSDMAIGLGRMFGFTFLENFNYPYVAQSIREFWKRWHISLSTWFRDYLYIPIGGNRISNARTNVNLIVVFFLCGLWHGASWTFVVWGFYHGFFLILERTRWGRLLDEAPRPLRHLYVLLVATAGWVVFRSESLDQALSFLAAMAGFARGDGVVEHFGLYWENDLAVVLIAGALGSTSIFPRLNYSFARSAVRARFVSAEANRGALSLAKGFLLALALVYSAMLLAAQTHNPFIYFRF